MGPLFDDDGKPLGPEILEDIVKERYFISKRLNVSYEDTGKMSVLERRLILKFIADEIAEEKKQLEDIQNSRSYRKRSR